MWRSPEPRFDVASAICQGGRDYQEDAIVTDFPFGADSGVVVLADGMGGHAAGDVASKIVVTEVFSELKFQSAYFSDFETEIPQYLTAAAVNANDVMRDHVTQHPDTRGMGATLVSIVIVENRMFWMSIGDSPLYHFRNGQLRQLNDDHSLAPQIDFMVQSGLLDPAVGKNHPDRNCLTSVILGDRVAKSDCPKTPFKLDVGDIIVVSSDGLQYLDDAQIQRILHKYRRKKAAEIAGYLLEAIEALADPDQDNCTFCVIKLNHNKPVIRAVRPKPAGHVDAPTPTTTRVVDIATGIAATPSAPDTGREIKPTSHGTTGTHDATDAVDGTTPPEKFATRGS
ncbi:PP2C family protein-serine/threonine phosphatase [Yoonia sp.]|uniref:PP2C family protein-serine/threonine phosphatase n=1 Tax=Yoonia sp. TaxID=2212373 RepID=UPI003F70D585